MNKYTFLYIEYTIGKRILSRVRDKQKRGKKVDNSSQKEYNIIYEMLVLRNDLYEICCIFRGRHGGFPL